MSTVDSHGSKERMWIGVDLDGTLAMYHGWVGAWHVGKPIYRMTDRVGQWLSDGKRVKIMTARVSPNKPDAQECREAIEQWLEDVFGDLAYELEITHEKDHLMLELWDDRAVQLIPNTGKRADSSPVYLLRRLVAWIRDCFSA